MDPRLISTGRTIPSEGYADQPYIVRTEDGAWLCVMTTGRGKEGDTGQHVISLRSRDQGATWEPPVPVEPAEGPEASYAVLLKVPGGRIYCFYNHNTDQVREVRREDGGVYRRVDSLGHYVFKFSDDHGRTWSDRRWEIPVREFACDRENIYSGKLRFFWNVGRPIVHSGAAYVPLHKVGAMGVGFFAQSEGVFLRSSNLLTQRDPNRIVWETLPEGDVGLRTPLGGGRIAEEQSLVALSDGSLYCVYRTVDGWPACSYSRDGGRTWSVPQYKSYSPGGQRIKHPRAANFVWRCENGRYLYWFHNHGGSPVRRLPAPWDPYADRNPVWLCAGEERDSPEGRVLHWTQPEILLYDDDSYVRMSYPDLVEENGRVFVTETQKNVGRVHEVSPDLLRGLFAQRENEQIPRDGLVFEWVGEVRPPREAPLPRLPAFLERDVSRPDYGTKDLRGGFSVTAWIRPAALRPGQVLLDNRTEAGIGFAVDVSEAGTLRITLSDGRTRSCWDTDPGVLQPDRLQHAALIVDAGPKVICWLIDGVLCDGGEARQFGWGRFSPALRGVNGAPSLKLAPSWDGSVRSLRIYSRAIRISEAVGSYAAARRHAW